MKITSITHVILKRNPREYLNTGAVNTLGWYVDDFRNALERVGHKWDGWDPAFAGFYSEYTVWLNWAYITLRKDVWGEA